jgi:glycosyltransferase involved in cell wall biosynthesis
MVQIIPMNSKSDYPKISVVTPSYNQGEYLEKTMLSVLDQEYPNLEYIVIDGGSTDKSLKIIKKYSSKLHYWQSKKDKGQSDAINQGFNRSSGEIMLWINSDDVLLPGSLYFIASVFSAFPEIRWLTSLPATISPDGFFNFVASPPWYVRSLIQKGLYTRKYCGFIMQEGTFWRRSLWEETGSALKDVPYTMDWDLWKRFADKDELILAKVLLAGYRLNPNRKNNDEHSKYYEEIGDMVPEKLLLPVKFLWRKIAGAAHILKVPALVFFDESTSAWVFRNKRGVIRQFQILS